jgi:hypothetical protein
MSPDLYSLGHTTTSWVVPLNQSSVLPVTCWNWVKSSQQAAFGVNIVAPDLQRGQYLFAMGATPPVRKRWSRERRRLAPDRDARLL